MSSPRPASLSQPVRIFPIGWEGAAFSLLQGWDVLPFGTRFITMTRCRIPSSVSNSGLHQTHNLPRILFFSEVPLPVFICSRSQWNLSAPAVAVGTWGRLILLSWFQPPSMAFGISVPGTCWYLSFFRQVKGRELTVISCPKIPYIQGRLRSLNCCGFIAIVKLKLLSKCTCSAFGNVLLRVYILP